MNVQMEWRFVSSDYFHRQTFRAESGDYTFTLKQGNGPGWWHLTAEVAIPFDPDELARSHRRWIEVEAAWASGEKYDASGLLSFPETAKKIGVDTPPNGGTRLTTNEVKAWASEAAVRLMDAHRAVGVS